MERNVENGILFCLEKLMTNIEIDSLLKKWNWIWILIKMFKIELPEQNVWNVNCFFPYE